MTVEQLQLMILYLIGFHTDEYMSILCSNNEPFIVNGKQTYINDGVSIIPSNGRLLLDFVYNKFNVIKIFEYIIYNMHNKNGITVYMYYTEYINNELIVYIKTNSTTMQSKQYSNHCLAYIDILLQLHNVYIDLSIYNKE